MSIGKTPQLQAEVDAIDLKIIALLKSRFNHSRRIGELRAVAGKTLYDPQRVAAQVEAFAANCAAHGLEPVMGRQLISAIIAQILVERVNAV